MVTQYFTKNAYGWRSALTDRKGFDSLVQMSKGIAAKGSEQKKSNKPVHMPAQALDHGAGYLMAAGICQARSLLFQNQKLAQVKSSLVGVANFLFEVPVGNIHGDLLTEKDFSTCLVNDDTHWGLVNRVLAPGTIGKRRGEWAIKAGPLGRHDEKFKQK